MYSYINDVSVLLTYETVNKVYVACYVLLFGLKQLLAYERLCNYSLDTAVRVSLSRQYPTVHIYLYIYVQYIYILTQVFCHLDTGFCHLDTGFRHLDTGFRHLDTGFSWFPWVLEQML